MLQLDEEKMSKSVGNIVSLREVLDAYGREAILVFFLGAHWRSPIDYSDEAMEAAKTVADDFRNARRVVETRDDVRGWNAFAGALDDDFNTPAALALMHEWRAAGRLDLLARALLLFGLPLPLHPDAPPEVMELADARFAARAARDFEKADRLRAEIEALGWEMQDMPDGGFRLVARL
jgi:cysteinyl-tRNA synthetase